MADSDPADVTDSVRETLRGVLEEHPVSFALLFGSAARETMADRSDVDVAVEFDDGDVIVGSHSHRTELERELTGEPPTRRNARARVAAAVERLREGSS